MDEYIELRIEESNNRGVHFYVAGQSRKFKSEAENEKKQIDSALKLQKLIKDDIKLTQGRIDSLNDKDTMYVSTTRHIAELESHKNTQKSLIEESENE